MEVKTGDYIGDLKRMKYRFLVTYISVVFSALSVIPVAYIPDDLQGFSIVAALSMLGTVGFGITAFLVCHSTSAIRKKYEKDKNDISFTKIMDRIFTLSFFKNKPAVVFDVLLLASFTIVGFSDSLGVLEKNEWIAFAFMIVFILSIEFHMVFNGKNYNYYKHHTAGGIAQVSK